MTNTIGAKPVIDTTSFQSGIKQMNSELRVLESGFKASAAALGDWSNNATGLELRSKSLTEQIVRQQQKVAATRAEWERVKQTSGENSLAANRLETDLNKQTETLNKMEGELKTTDQSLQEMKDGTQETGDAVQDMGTKEEGATNKTETFKSALAGVAGIAQAAVTAILAVAAAALAVVGAIGALVIKSAEYGSGIADMSAKTGIGTTQLQELSYAAKILGTDIDTIAGAQAKLVRSMASASDGTGEQAKAFSTLGVSVTDAQGNLRNTQDVFNDTIDALGKIQNPAERDALAMAVFGKSAQELNPLIKAGSGEIKKLGEEAVSMGAVVDEAGIKKLDEFGDSLDGLKMGFQGVMAQIAISFLPGFSGIVDQAKGYLKQLVNIVQNSNGDIGKMAGDIGTLFGNIVTDIAKQIPGMLQVGLSIMTSLLDSLIAALPTLLTAASDILNSLVKFIVTALPIVIPAAIKIILKLVDAIIQNLPMLINAALQAIIALANGLAAALPGLVPVLAQMMVLIVQTITDNLPMLIDAALLLLTALAQGIGAALPILIPAIISINQQIFKILVDSTPSILQAAGQIIMALAQGLADAVPQTWIKASEGFLANLGIQVALWLIKVRQVAIDIVTAIKNGLLAIPEVGKSIVTGIWTGIDGNIQWLLGKVAGFADSIIQYVQDAFLMQSPSKKGIAIGRNFITSIAIGGEQAMSDVQHAFTSMTGKLTVAAAGGFAGAGSSSQVTSTDNSVDVWGNVIINGDGGSLAQSLTGKRF